LNKTSEKNIESITLRGRLVGLDVELGSLHMTFSEGEDITGRLAPSYTGGAAVEVPANYTAKLIRETVIHYSTQEDRITYQLAELVRGETDQSA
jgi:hypothetical protein